MLFKIDINRVRLLSETQNIMNPEVIGSLVGDLNHPCRQLHNLKCKEFRKGIWEFTTRSKKKVS